MAQITFRLHTALAGVASGTMATTNVQALPVWAAPIQYVGTTGDWLALMVSSTTTLGKDVIMRKVKVFAYGRSSALRQGKECVVLSQPVTEVSATKHHYLTLSYRAVGETVRP